MRYDRDIWRRRPRSRADFAPRGEYGADYEGPYPRRGWSEGFLGGGLRSRGSWTSPGQEIDEFEWGDGYVGGRGYGGTNYDLAHGYATGGQSFRTRPPRGGPPREGPGEFSSPATRGGYAWGEAEASEEYGPARYGYGPYYDRLRRRRRSDDELRQEVEDTLFYDTWVDADAISVAVQDGVVTLRGTLPNYEELRYAVDDVWDVDGVRGVRSEMEVNEDRGEASGTPAARYTPGAPHMHGHPEAGEGERETRTRTSTRTSTGGEREKGKGGGGATSAPPTGEGMATQASAGGTGSRRASREGRAGARRSGGPEGRREKGRHAAGDTGSSAEGGTGAGESAAGTGDGSSGLAQS